MRVLMELKEEFLNKLMEAEEKNLEDLKKVQSENNDLYRLKERMESQVSNMESKELKLFNQLEQVRETQAREMKGMEDKLQQSMKITL
jgi:hypothetical protein